MIIFYFLITLFVTTPLISFCQEKQYLPAQNVVIQEPQQEQSQQNQTKSVSDKRMRKQTCGTTILNATGLGAKWSAILGTIIGTILHYPLFHCSNLGC